jgi:hypothetical protein
MTYEHINIKETTITINGEEFILTPKPKPTVLLDFYINVYPEGFRFGATIGLTRKRADEISHQDRVACLHMQREVKKGEGLCPTQTMKFM